MLDRIKRVLGELVMLLIMVNAAYLLLSLLHALQWEARVAAVSLILAGAAVAMVRLQ